MSDIIWTKTDEAPLLASYSLFPILKSFLNRADISIDVADISLAGRIIAAFSDVLKDDQKEKDWLEILGNMTEDKFANIIKLPNISASIPQLNDAINELRAKGYDLPLYPNEPKNDKEREIYKRYQKVLGSAVNPVLRQGNSDRRCVSAVKEYARNNPHKMGEFKSDSKSEVAYMKSGDFYFNERSMTAKSDDTLRVEFTNKNGEKTILKEIKVLKGEVIDATFMSAKALKQFIIDQIKDTKAKDLLFSVHLKATMMKVSDPVIFGHFVKKYFIEAFDEFKDEFKSVGINENNGLKDLFERILKLDKNTQDKIRAKFDEIYIMRPDLAMVNSDAGITNLHVPSDIIIDASMPVMIRNSGKMWDKNGALKEAKAVIPDSTYAKIYEAVIEDFKQKGTLDPSKIGSVSNVGLMAKKAEEYGSHDKTFIMSNDGILRVINLNDEEIFKFEICKDDIFRMTQAKDDAITDWVNLGIKRAKLTNTKAIFWLDENRAHDKEIIKKVKEILSKSDLSGVDIEILRPDLACKKSLDIIRSGKDCISVTGNVLRDYLTDLFPILELGTSAKMLSVVPLLNGGGVFETGAGGSAPKIAEQFFNENHLRWDSLGEFLALIASLEHLANLKSNQNAKILSSTLNSAVSRWLKENRSPQKEVKTPDNRSSHFYLALYWAEELTKNGEILADKFKDMAKELKENEKKIVQELLEVQGQKMDIKGYYKFDENLASKAMRPSETFNKIIN
ncbi:NADP-dependent isocitrate dehydrogenase [Campylobacter sp. RM16190]|uniref:NADP-dependent isocitrate dehydrogenase n=1 Tax=Campylobacter sp. RM16190 TaxID=1705727 RepID=UPI001474C9E6|nr:NADP-dependent isocitrate dehydrogenase [Campylobacter sp. RM16190]